METENFTEALFKAIDEKLRRFNANEMRDLHEEYRILHTCVKILYETLIKRGVIKADPYKLDKKISSVAPVEDEPFNENESKKIIGMRFSDYESMLDYICSYYNFSVERITLPEIKKLNALNNSFLWTSFNVNNQKCNTRCLAQLVFDMRRSSDPMTAQTITDAITKSAKSMQKILTLVRELTSLEKEIYKARIRREVFLHPNFPKTQFSSEAEEIKQIRETIPKALGKFPVYNDLISEIAAEDCSSNSQKLRAALFSKLNATTNSSEEKKKPKIDSKEVVMEALRSLGSLTPQFNVICEKIAENHDLLESEHNTLKDKMIKFLKKTFNIAEKPCVYTILISDQKTNAQRRETIEYQKFLDEITTRSKRYAALTIKNSPIYNKLKSMEEKKILEFLTRQISECNKILELLNALDDYFKSAANPSNKSKLKSTKLELTAMKNTVIKTNQRRAEYIAFVEEEEQMKKLGIKNEE